MYLAYLRVDSKKIQKSVFGIFVREIHRSEPVESQTVSRMIKILAYLGVARESLVKIESQSVPGKVMIGKKSLSGGGWHEVQIVRRGKSVTLVVDKIENTADIPGGSGSGIFQFFVPSEYMCIYR